MAKRHVYSKDTTGYGDFVYVDLLPEVRRARQFNMRIIVLLLYTISITFVLIYIPYSSATFEREEINAINNDLKHELTLTQEEYEGYEIDLDAISFQEDIDGMELSQIDYTNVLDTIKIYCDINDGTIKDMNYSASNNSFSFSVSITQGYKFSTLEQQLLNLDWIESVTHTEPVKYNGEIQYTARFTIEVKTDVE